MSQALRFLHILKIMPVNSRIALREIAQKLEALEHHVSMRQIQRDLIELSTEFDIVSDGKKPSGWKWRDSQSVTHIPQMAPHAALTFKMVEEYLLGLLPHATSGFLKPYFDEAKRILCLDPIKHLARWPEKVALILRGPTIVPPNVPEEILQAVYQALFDEAVLQVEYRSRGETESKNLLVHPLGLVYRHGIAYLVCCIDEHLEPRQLVLHRMLQVEILDEHRRMPNDFKLDEYIRSGNFGILTKGTSEQCQQGELSPGVSESERHEIRVTLRFSPQAGAIYHEVTLGRDMQVETEADGRVNVSTTLDNTCELRWCLEGYGDRVEVLEPPELRREFVELAHSLTNIYGPLGDEKPMFQETVGSHEDVGEVGAVNNILS